MNHNNTYSISPEHNRTVRVIGKDGLRKLQNAHVIVFGIGGVGGHCAEALARAGVGHLTLVDGDTVSLSNINRQTVALHSTVGQNKVDVLAERIHDIHPDCEVTPLHLFYSFAEEERLFRDGHNIDYVADCIDSVASKIDLILACHKRNIPIISAMAAGNKLHPERFQIMDLFKTNTDPLAKIMRRELKLRNIDRLKVVCSDEPPIPVSLDADPEPGQLTRTVPAPGSLSFVPAVMGLVMAGEIIRTLSGVEESRTNAKAGGRQTGGKHGSETVQ